MKNQILYHAFVYLRDHGWAKGQMGGGGKPACLVGAMCEGLRAAHGGRLQPYRLIEDKEEMREAYRTLLHEVRFRFGFKGRRITSWNDQVATWEHISTLIEHFTREPYKYTGASKWHAEQMTTQLVPAVAIPQRKFGLTPHDYNLRR